MSAQSPFRNRNGPGFELIETLRWEPDSGFVRLERHIARLASSARQLGFLFSRPALDDRLKTVTSAGPLRVRLTLVEGRAARRCHPTIPASSRQERSGGWQSPRHVSMLPTRLSATKPHGGRSTRPRVLNTGRRKPTKSFSSTRQVKFAKARSPTSLSKMSAAGCSRQPSPADFCLGFFAQSFWLLDRRLRPN